MKLVLSLGLFFLLFWSSNARVIQNGDSFIIHKNPINPLRFNLTENLNVKCFLCHFIVGYFDEISKQDNFQVSFIELAEKVCQLLTKYSPYVCRNLIPKFKAEFFYVVDKLALSPKEVCGFFYQPNCGKFYNPFADWSVKIPPKPPKTEPKPETVGSKVLKILHLTDLHHDPMYVEGTNANCGQPLCCRAINGKPSSPSDMAGKWGDLRKCDLPLQTLANMLNHINSSHKIDYIFWTGDFPPHDDWFQTRKSQKQSVQNITNYLTKYFSGIPVFPALGNHESCPVNSFPPPYIKGNNSISWLYEKLNQTWGTWLNKYTLPIQRTNSILKGAYYSVRPQAGYKIISMNMNYCNDMNWWLLTNMTDPADELTWLVAELTDSEKMKESVHIIGHIPPPECPKVWGRNYQNIINRFKDIIKGTFFGHTHIDEVHVHYDGKDKVPTAVMYVSPSGTTYNGLNPAYRIYDVDDESWSILDHHNYFLNITEANLSDKPKWKLEYSAKDAYNMSDLSPSSWNKVIENFKTDENSFIKYYGYRVHSSGLEGECDESCRKKTICELQTAVSGDTKFC